MSPREMEGLFMQYLRLYHHPVAIFLEGPEERRITPEFAAKNRLSFCQFLAFVRETGNSIYMEPPRLGCPTAADVFGLKVDPEKAIKTLTLYLSKEEAERFYESRPRLSEGEIEAVGLAPLALCEEEPDAVIFVTDALQAVHLLDFYAKGADQAEITMSHHVNGAACGNTIKAIKSGTPQLALPCPGAFTSGKMERGELLLAFPWPALTKCASVLKERAEKGSVSFLGGATLVGMDVCRNCPLIKLEKLK